MNDALSNPLEFLRLERPSEDIAVVVLSRPSVMNAFNRGMVAELRSVFRGLEGDPARVVIVTGDGDHAFSTGGDLREMLEMTEQQARDSLRRGVAMTREIEQSAKITIAAINGAALGGGMELTLACDLRVARPDSKIGFPETKVGIFPGWGGTVRLPRLVTGAIAKQLLLTGCVIDGTRAADVGLVNGTADDVMSLATSLATELLAGAPIAQQQAKLVTSCSIDMSIDDAMSLENEAWMRTYFSEDRREGHQAFIDRRRPSWTSR